MYGLGTRGDSMYGPWMWGDLTVLPASEMCAESGLRLLRCA